MTNPARRSEHPVSMRLAEADVVIIDRAANLGGRSRTDFVREAAVRAAEELIMENRLVRMSPKGFAQFMEIVSTTAAPVPEMVELVKRPGLGSPVTSPKVSRALIGPRTVDVGA